jgi:methylated-DNA-[protein]-cysteine S-methyltransferase
MATDVVFSWIDSPVGHLLGVMSAGTLIGLHFAGEEGSLPEPGWVQDDEAFDELRGQMEEYFAGERKSFDIAMAASGTPFQEEVWEALCDIPYGATASYVEVADAIGRPAAMRAVGGANGANPIPILIPCHRVIAADGTLGGYGGGLDRKVALLEIEDATFRR